MKPFTQLPRAFPVPDPKKKKKGRRSGGEQGLKSNSTCRHAAEQANKWKKSSHTRPGRMALVWPHATSRLRNDNGHRARIALRMFQERGVNYLDLVETTALMACRLATIWIDCDRKDYSTVRIHVTPMKSKPCAPIATNTTFAF